MSWCALDLIIPLDMLLYEGAYSAGLVAKPVHSSGYQSEPATKVPEVEPTATYDWMEGESPIPNHRLGILRACVNKTDATVSPSGVYFAPNLMVWKADISCMLITVRILSSSFAIELTVLMPPQIAMRTFMPDKLFPIMADIFTQYPVEAEEWSSAIWSEWILMDQIV